MYSNILYGTVFYCIVVLISVSPKPGMVLIAASNGCLLKLAT